VQEGRQRSHREELDILLEQGERREVAAATAAAAAAVENSVDDGTDVEDDA
jgi:hypothetical protein